MRNFSLAVVFLGALLAPALLVTGPAGEVDPSASNPAAGNDTANRIREAWREIHGLQREGESAEAARRQRAFAEEFFASYLAHPEATAGQQALATAFRMWSHAGDDESIEAALSRVDRGSRRWVQLIRLARPAFAAAERVDEFRVLVAGLAGELTDPEVASEVWIFLGRDYRGSTEPDRAADCFRHAVELDAHPRLVDSARSALRELDRLAVGRVAPGFSATDLVGDLVRLSDFEGRFVLLVFWSSECVTCLSELDHLRWVRAAYPPERLALVGVTLDSLADDARRVVDERRWDWPQVFDPEAANGPVARLYEVLEGPRSFLIDPEGLIAARDVSGEELDAILAELLPRPEEAGTKSPNAE